MSNRPDPVAATFAERTMALLIDCALLTLGHGAVFALVVAGLNGLGARALLGSIIALFLCLPIFLLAYIVLSMAYFTLLPAWGGQTPGKLAMGIRVVPDGQPATLGGAFLRWVGYLVSTLPLGAGFLWAALDKDRRAWHDHLAATVVLVKRKEYSS
ncbi:MAG: RDD family protein [Desulfobacterales bacterium]|nr:RDD family protein [Desulfobacterales bacterium]